MIFSNPAARDPQEVGLTECYLPIGRSDTQQGSRMEATPGPPNCDMTTVVDDFVDVALEVQERGSESLQLDLKPFPASHRMPVEGNVRNKILCEYFRVFRSISSSRIDACKNSWPVNPR
jgi:hypothetical protein